MKILKYKQQQKKILKTYIVLFQIYANYILKTLLLILNFKEFLLIAFNNITKMLYY